MASTFFGLHIGSSALSSFQDYHILLGRHESLGKLLDT